jgi:hypothetical protein
MSTWRAVRHTCDDYNAWKPVFDEAWALREEYGAAAEMVFHPAVRVAVGPNGRGLARRSSSSGRVASSNSFPPTGTSSWAMNHRCRRSPPCVKRSQTTRGLLRNGAKTATETATNGRSWTGWSRSDWMAVSVPLPSGRLMWGPWSSVGGPPWLCSGGQTVLSSILGSAGRAGPDQICEAGPRNRRLAWLELASGPDSGGTGCRSFNHDEHHFRGSAVGPHRPRPTGHGPVRPRSWSVDVTAPGLRPPRTSVPFLLGVGLCVGYFVTVVPLSSSKTTAAAQFHGGSTTDGATGAWTGTINLIES